MGRMERYNQDSTTNRRSNKNQDLYKNIYELGEYSNIEGIATIDKSNEVDITKVKNMLKNREEYQRQKDIKKFTSSEVEIPTYEVFEPDSDKVYDIRDILNKAKINKLDKEEHKSLDSLNFEILKELKEKHDTKIDKDNVHELMDTIAHTSKLNKLSDKELGLDMFDDLKSDDNTTVEDRTSIRALLEEAKKNDESKLASTDTNIDKSFYTSSLNFGNKDYEQIKELNKSVKKNNILMRILFFTVLLVLTGVVIYFVFNMIK